MKRESSDGCCFSRNLSSGEIYNNLFLFYFLLTMVVLAEVYRLLCDYWKRKENQKIFCFFHVKRLEIVSLFIFYLVDSTAVSALSNRRKIDEWVREKQRFLFSEINFCFSSLFRGLKVSFTPFTLSYFSWKVLFFFC